MDATATLPEWESELAAWLTHMSALQEDLLDLLARKRDLLATADMAGLAAIQAEEQEMLCKLEACQDARCKLLARAAEQGIKCDSVQAIAQVLPLAPRAGMQRRFKEAASRARMLRHQSLANWVLVQRSLIHLSQLLEIIATGGRMQPTYGSAAVPAGSGSLVDQAA